MVEVATHFIMLLEVANFFLKLHTWGEEHSAKTPAMIVIQIIFLYMPFVGDVRAM